jgi:DNA replication ATP-dependent helicase Dna2
MWLTNDTSPVLSKQKFDYCIVDEASQLTLPATLGPICMANVFVLVGDHHQLSPTVGV